MTIRSASRGLTGFLVAAALLLSGCAESRVPDSASFNEADLKFVEQMIPHHEQAVSISRLAEERSQDDEILSLASDISFIQSIELEELQGWLLEWGFSDATDDHDSHGSMAGMLTDEELQQLEAASGSEFDVLWAQLMGKHHQGAIEAARSVLSDGKQEEIRFFAESVIEVQGVELEQLQSISARLVPQPEPSE